MHERKYHLVFFCILRLNKTLISNVSIDYQLHHKLAIFHFFSGNIEKIAERLMDLCELHSAGYGKFISIKEW